MSPRHPASRTCGDVCRFALVYLLAWLAAARKRGVRRDLAKAQLLLVANRLWSGRV